MNWNHHERSGRGTSKRSTSSVAASGALFLLSFAITAGVGISTAVAAPTTTQIPGLFGVQDPTYDGVYRQSEAILAFAALGKKPPATAVTWLLDQQCANGGWQAFRASTTTPCAVSSSKKLTGPDSNSTAMAVQALAAIGRTSAADGGLEFLTELQNADGGIAYLKGAPSDANSTGLAAAAVSSRGRLIGDVANDSQRTLDLALTSLHIRCEGEADQRGGYRFQIGDEPFANDYSTAQAVLGANSRFLPVDTASADDAQSAPSCPATGAPTAAQRNSAGAWYLANKLDDNGGTIPSAYTPGTTDWSSTRFAVISLAATGHGVTAIRRALTALAGSQDSTIVDADGHDRPGVLAELILANEAARNALGSAAGSGPRASRTTSALRPSASQSAALDSRALLTRLSATLQTSPTSQPSASSGPQTTSSPGASGLAASGTNAAAARSAAVGLLFLVVGVLLVAVTSRRTTRMH